MILDARSVFLKTIALSVTLTLVYSIVKPIAPRSLDLDVSLPDTFSLPGWKAQPTQSISPPLSNSKYNRILSGQRYSYRQGERSLQIAVRYVVETEGDIGQLMADSSELSNNMPNSFEDRQSSNGFYRLFTHQNQAYLESCLNLNRYNTVTPIQFRQNAYVQALQSQQWLGWLMSKRPLLERRCLWIQISTPILERNVQAAQVTLEQSWEILVASWRLHG